MLPEPKFHCNPRCIQLFSMLPEPNSHSKPCFVKNFSMLSECCRARCLICLRGSWLSGASLSLKTNAISSPF